MSLILLALAAASTAAPQPKAVDPGTWIGAYDYPATARMLGVTGTVGFALAVDEKGAVTGCAVTSSSGDTALDASTCDLLKVRARFAAARDAGGRPVASTYRSRLRWQLPEPVAVAPPQRPGLRTLFASNLAFNGFDPVRRLPGRGILTGRSTVPLAREDPAPVATGEAPPPDPGVRSGRLANGLRYAVMRNPLPAGGASLRMEVHVGSSVESPQQAGYAHLVEHMVYRGTAALADGEYERSLQAMGLRLGADNTANTYLDSTIFALDFPSRSTIGALSGIAILRDIASRASIAADVFATERGVVLSEKRVVDTPAARAAQARMDFLLGARKALVHPIIGTDATLAAASAETVRAFYRAHYTPANVSIVVVGDVDPAAVEAQIHAKFDDWAAAKADPAPPAWTGPAGGPRVKLFAEPGAPDQMLLDWTRPRVTEPNSFAHQRVALARSAALQILNDRLLRRSDEPTPPFSLAVAAESELLRAVTVTSLSLVPSVSGGAGDPAGAVRAALEEVRRLRLFPPTPDELASALASISVRADQLLAERNTRSSPQIAAALLHAMDEGAVFPTPTQEAADIRRLGATLTERDVQAAAATLFPAVGHTLFAAGQTPPASELALSGAMAEAERAEVQAPALRHAAAWPYARFGAPGAIADRRDYPDVGITVAHFANGTSLTVKRILQPSDQITACLNFGAGYAGLAPGLERAYWMASDKSVFVLGGLGRATWSDVNDQFSGREAGATMLASEERFQLVGQTRLQDLDAQLQLLTAFVADPAFRPSAARRAAAGWATALAQIEATPLAVAQRDPPALLHGGDPRWRITPSAADLNATDVADLRALLAPALAGPLNLLLVGNVDVDRALEAARNTIGALPPRGPRVVARPTAFPASGPTVVEAVRTRSDQTVAVAAWPTQGFFASHADARALQILSQLVELRLIDGLRERDGATYSPTGFSDQSEVFPNYGMIAAEVEIAPAKVDRFFREVDAIVADLAAKPVAPEELGRAQAPMLTAVEQQFHSADYWLYALARTDEDPRTLDVLRTKVADLSAVSPADIQRLARQYLAGRAPYRLVVRGGS